MIFKFARVIMLRIMKRRFIQNFENGNKKSANEKSIVGEKNIFCVIQLRGESGITRKGRETRTSKMKHNEQGTAR